MANWTAAGMPAQMFKRLSAYVPPPAGFVPPVLWGDEATVTERLEQHFTGIRLNRRLYPQWHYPFTTAELVDLFRTQFGPVKKAFDVLDAKHQRTLAEELEEIYARNSEIRDGVLTITNGEYLEVVATRK